MQMIQCYYCNSNRFKFISPKVTGELTLPLMKVERNMYKCLNCELYFTFPLPEREIIDDFYTYT